MVLPREPSQPKLPPNPGDPLPPEIEAQMMALASRLMLLIPLGLGIGAAVLSFGANEPASFMATALAGFAAITAGSRRPLTGGALVVGSALIEWFIWRTWPGISPLPMPLVTLLFPTLVLVILELRRPFQLASDPWDLLTEHGPSIWRLLILAVPVMLASFYGLFSRGN